MSQTDVDLNCMIYVDSKPDCESLATALPSVKVRDNEDFDPAQRAEFPGGFKFFRWYIEVDESDAATLEHQVEVVGAILEYCWARDFPAVAVCEYEDRLPRAGGYNNRDIPWPRQ